MLFFSRRRGPDSPSRVRLWIQGFIALGFIAFLIQSSACGDVSVALPGCEDCPERCLRTEGGRGRCAECLGDAQCQSDSSPTRKCLSNKCVCGTDKDCPQNKYCDGSSTCAECLKDSHCQDSKFPVCLEKKCVQCNPGSIETCAPDGIEACAKGTRKCLGGGFWGTCEEYLICKQNERCVKGACYPSCPDPAPCKEGEQLCLTPSDVLPGRFKKCVQNSQFCWEWDKQERYCGAKEVCEKGQCNPFTCDAPECKLGETRCESTDTFSLCGRDKNNCIIWLPKEPCGKAKKCRPTLGECTLCEPKSKQDCYPGDPATKGIGACKTGTQICKEDGSAFGICVGAVLPQREVCNEIDDDCDGAVDEDFKTKGDECEAGIGACKTKGKLVCKVNGFGVECDAQPGSSKQEECNGKDDDCDGQVDNINGKTDPIQQNCYTGDSKTQGVGLCKDGKQTCVKGSWGKCNNDVLPAKEACDGKDNDCDGKTDEDFQLGTACTVGKGICEAKGTLVCKKGGSGAECSARPGVPAIEICDGLDNNCDGSVDEKLTRPCFSGNTGCSKTGTFYSCKGPCKPGVETCSSGKWVNCTGDVVATKEVCDGIDNDCNGSVDEGLPTASYYPDVDKDTFGDSKAPPKVTCAALAPKGAVTNNKDCNDNNKNIKPGVQDVCDGVDNNCNTVIDENATKATYYFDSDGDGYGGVSASKITACKRNATTLCTGLNACRPSKGWASKGGDCCDTDNQAFPGQIRYFTGRNRCGSFDYNCNSKVDHEYKPCSCSRSVKYSYQGYADSYRSGEGWRRWYTRSKVTQTYSNTTCEMRMTISLQPNIDTSRSQYCRWCKTSVLGICFSHDSCTSVCSIAKSKALMSWTPKMTSAYYVMWNKTSFSNNCAYKIDGNQANCGDTVYRNSKTESFGYTNNIVRSGLGKVSASCKGRCGIACEARVNYVFTVDNNYVFSKRLPSTSAFKLGCR